MIAQKSYAPFAVKALDEEARTFTGLASTWQVDLGGDVIRKGAFRDTLADWKQSGRTIPLLDSHAAHSVRAVVGKLIDAKEAADGLEATFQVIEGPDGDEVYRRIRGGYVDGLSIGYEAIEWAKPEDEDRKKGVWRILKRIKLMEVSVVLWPMNQGARIADVKSMLDVADPDRLTDEDRKELRALASRIGALLRPPPAEKAAGDSEDATEPEPAPAAPPQPPEQSADAKADDEPTAPIWMQEALRARIGKVLVAKTLTGG